jgi:hypothetical protein
MSLSETARPSAGRVAPRALEADLPPLTPGRRLRLEWILRLATAGAFIGHGAYGVIMEKPGWYGFFHQFHISRASVEAHSLMQWVGGFEMVLGILALVAPVRALLLAMFLWKVGVEWIWYPLAGLPGWEFVERWSNYTAPLALLLVRGWPRTWRDWLR